MTELLHPFNAAAQDEILAKMQAKALDIVEKYEGSTIEDTFHKSRTELKLEAIQTFSKLSEQRLRLALKTAAP